MEFKRRDQQTKKQFYRRIALIKKQSWATSNHLQDEEYFKSHFIISQEDTGLQNNKSKKIVKSQHRSEQRLRNRVAAQQSRQRHRSYVEELQRKVKMYEQLLDAQGVLCKNCQKSLLSQTHESESIIAQSLFQCDLSSNLLKEDIQDQAIVNSYLDNQMIRIDNQGATTPFGIFFILCLVGVLTVFSFNFNNQDIAPRLLANYHSTINQLISQQSGTIHQSSRLHAEHPKLFEFVKPHHKEDELGWQTKETAVGSPSIPFSLQSSVKNQNWTKYGNYICSEPEIVLDKKAEKQRKRPEFLLLRTGRNSLKQQKKKQTVQEQNQGQSYKILPKEWQRVEISSCFLDKAD